MTAARHISDALDEAKRLDDDVDTLIQALRFGKVIGFEDLAHLRRMTTVIRTHAALAYHDIRRMPQIEHVSDKAWASTVGWVSARTQPPSSPTCDVFDYLP